MNILDSFKNEYLFWMNILDFFEKNTIKAGGSTVRAQNVDWVSGWSGWYPLYCYDY